MKKISILSAVIVLVLFSGWYFSRLKDVSYKDFPDTKSDTPHGESESVSWFRPNKEARDFVVTWIYRELPRVTPNQEFNISGSVKLVFNNPDISNVAQLSIQEMRVRLAKGGSVRYTYIPLINNGDFSSDIPLDDGKGIYDVDIDILAKKDRYMNLGSFSLENPYDPPQDRPSRGSMYYRRGFQFDEPKTKEVITENGAVVIRGKANDSRFMNNVEVKLLKEPLGEEQGSVLLPLDARGEFTGTVSVRDPGVYRGVVYAQALQDTHGSDDHRSEIVIEFTVINKKSELCRNTRELPDTLWEYCD